MTYTHILVAYCIHMPDLKQFTYVNQETIEYIPALLESTDVGMWAFEHNNKLGFITDADARRLWTFLYPKCVLFLFFKYCNLFIVN